MDDELTKLTISMPRWMLDQLRDRARRRGTTVSEHIRRSVALEQLLLVDHADDHLVLRKPDGNEITVRFL